MYSPKDPRSNIWFEEHSYCRRYSPPSSCRLGYLGKLQQEYRRALIFFSCTNVYFFIKTTYTTYMFILLGICLIGGPWMLRCLWYIWLGGQKSSGSDNRNKLLHPRNGNKSQNRSDHNTFRDKYLDNAKKTSTLWWSPSQRACWRGHFYRNQNGSYRCQHIQMLWPSLIIWQYWKAGLLQGTWRSPILIRPRIMLSESVYVRFFDRCDKYREYRVFGLLWWTGNSQKKSRIMFNWF